MDQERERIQDDLRGLLEGEVRCDDIFLQMYASDASIYEIRPLGVIRPRTTADVQACVQYAAENGLPLHARGAGTGVSGQSIGPGLILDFSNSLRRIIEIGDDFARVQPGVVLAQLNRQLFKHNRIFGPDPATRSVTTMGSVVAVDASGSHWPQYGAAHDHIREIHAVLADGQSVVLGKHALAESRVRREPEVVRLIVRRIRELLNRHKALIESYRPKTPICGAGYHLWDILDEEVGELDLGRLVTGSEGTLALFTELVIQTRPLPKHRGLTLFFFERLDTAARAAYEVSQFGAHACDMMDRRALTIARDVDPRFSRIIPHDAGALLLVELSGDDANEVRDRLRQLDVRLRRKKKLAFDSRTTMDQWERDLYWRLARRVVPMLYRLEGSTRPLPFVEDVVVPVAAIPDFLVKLQNVLKRHEVTASTYAHAAHGQLHIRPFLDLANPEDVRRMRQLSADLYAEVEEVGGAVSGEHGDGLSRTWYVRKYYGQLADVFREVKRIFDPQMLLNPGKIIADAPPPLTNNLRPVVAAQVQSEEDEAQDELPILPLGSQLLWGEGELVQTARSCNGCGRCRTQSLNERMCPIFRFAPREEASPRAKANLLRAAITGRLSPEELRGDAFKAVADLCVNCHQCRIECPAAVDIPKLALESKAQYVAVNGLNMSEWMLSRIDSLASWGAAFRSVANWSLRSRSMRWLMERMFGIAKARKLPQVAPRNFLRIAQRRRLTRPRRDRGNKVLYFVDTYANWFDTELGESLLAVLEHNSISVYVAPNLLSSGMPALGIGAVDAARRIAQHNVTILADAVRQGYQIIATEPAAALALQHEYLHILDDDDSRLVAENTSDACAYLWNLHQTGQLQLDLKPINSVIGYHQPCHIRAMYDNSPGRELLRLIPGLTVQDLQAGCSGMAGIWGLRRENYRNSLRAGWGLISQIRSPQVQVGATECSACKMQMEQGTTKPTIHPLKILALAYGVMPELAERMNQQGEELVVT